MIKIVSLISYLGSFRPFRFRAMPGNETTKPTSVKGMANKTHTTAFLLSSMPGNEKTKPTTGNEITKPTPVKGIANELHTTAVLCQIQKRLTKHLFPFFQLKNAILVSNAK